MSCMGLLLLTAVIIYFGALISFLLAAGTIPLAIMALVLAIAGIIFIWRVIYPWLVRMGRWSAQVKNIIFLAFVFTVLGAGLGYVIGVPTITLPVVGIQVPATVAVFVPLFLFLLFLGAVVWVVRLWRRGWPTVRDFFWDLLFRIVALIWRILLGIPLGITWFLYHPPISWLVGAALFYWRGISAGVAWLVYNPPVGSILKAIAWIMRIVGLVVAAILYNPPIVWLVQATVFILRLITRPISTVIYWIVSWWPVTGVKGTLSKGLTTEARSYEDYKYA